MNLSKVKTRLAAILSAAFIPLVSQATIVHGDFVNTGGTNWIGTFDITNDGTVPSVGEVSIYFDWTHASNLQLLASPSTWDPLVIQPDSGLPSDGYLDVLALDPANALLPGQSISGFQMSFAWEASAGNPTSFRFDVFDASFNLTDSGNTIPTGSISAVPEPTGLSLMLAGVGLVGVTRRSMFSKNK